MKKSFGWDGPTFQHPPQPTLNSWLIIEPFPCLFFPFFSPTRNLLFHQDLLQGLSVLFPIISFRSCSGTFSRFLSFLSNCPSDPIVLDGQEKQCDQVQTQGMQAQGGALGRQVGVGLSLLERVLGRGLRIYSYDRNSYLPHRGS